MKDIYDYFNAISPINKATWEMLKNIFNEHSLKKGEYFVKENEIAKKFGYLRSGVIRAFYRNNKGAEYNKHFFVQNSMVGGYSSLVSQQPNKITGFNRL